MTRRNAQRLAKVVADLLDVNHLDAGRLAIKPSSADLSALTAAVVKKLEGGQPRVALKRPRGKVMAKIDVERIRQVLDNLCAHARRYTPSEGHVEISVDQAPAAQFAEPWARVTVKYHGSGLSARQRDLVFEPFFDLASAEFHTSSGPDSAGMGLYIARGIVDLHGGLLTVASDETSFVEFTVLLPTESAQRDPKRAVDKR
jgi:signal transduction histidine kinase